MRSDNSQHVGSSESLVHVQPPSYTPICINKMSYEAPKKMISISSPSPYTPASLIKKSYEAPKKSVRSVRFLRNSPPSTRRQTKAASNIVATSPIITTAADADNARFHYPGVSSPKQTPAPLMKCKPRLVFPQSLDTSHLTPNRRAAFDEAMAKFYTLLDAATATLSKSASPARPQAPAPAPRQPTVTRSPIKTITTTAPVAAIATRPASPIVILSASPIATRSPKAPRTPVRSFEAPSNGFVPPPCRDGDMSPSPVTREKSFARCTSWLDNGYNYQSPDIHPSFKQQPQSRLWDNSPVPSSLFDSSLDDSNSEEPEIEGQVISSPSVSSSHADASDTRACDLPVVSATPSLLSQRVSSHSFCDSMSPRSPSLGRPIFSAVGDWLDTVPTPLQQVSPIPFKSRLRDLSPPLYSVSSCSSHDSEEELHIRSEPRIGDQSFDSMNSSSFFHQRTPSPKFTRSPSPAPVRAPSSLITRKVVVPRVKVPNFTIVRHAAPIRKSVTPPCKPTLASPAFRLPLPAAIRSPSPVVTRSAHQVTTHSPYPVVATRSSVLPKLDFTPPMSPAQAPLRPTARKVRTHSFAPPPPSPTRVARLAHPLLPELEFSPPSVQMVARPAKPLVLHSFAPPPITPSNQTSLTWKTVAGIAGVAAAGAFAMGYIAARYFF